MPEDLPPYYLRWIEEIAKQGAHTHLSQMTVLQLVAMARRGAGAPVSAEEHDNESVAQEADRIINGDRRSDYGGALESFTRIAELWSPILGVDVTPEQVCFCMVGLKMARWLNGQQRDSLVDAIGYVALVEHIQRERKDT